MGPSTSYDNTAPASPTAEYEPTEDGKKAHVKVMTSETEFPNTERRERKLSVYEKPKVPPRPLKQSSQDHVYEDLDNLRYGSDLDPSAPYLNQDFAETRDSKPLVKINDSSPDTSIQETSSPKPGIVTLDSGDYQTPYGYYSTIANNNNSNKNSTAASSSHQSQSHNPTTSSMSNENSTNQEAYNDTEYASTTAYVEPNEVDYSSQVPGYLNPNPIQTYERVTPQAPEPQYADYADIEQQGKNG